MHFFITFASGIAGLSAGLIVGMIRNGLANTSETILFGFVGAGLLVLVNFLLQVSAAQQSKQNTQRSSRLPRRRDESKGTYEERLNQYVKNTNIKDRTGDSSSSKMPFWECDEDAVYQRTPPKSEGLIRILLYRIKRILSGR